MVQKDRKRWKLVDQTKSWSNDDIFQWTRSEKLFINTL